MRFIKGGGVPIVMVQRESCSPGLRNSLHIQKTMEKTPTQAGFLPVLPALTGIKERFVVFASL
ncbi:MAG: hypothetical protein RR048_06650 [Oscillospiraceae bacterium]